MELSPDEVVDLLRWRCQQLGYHEHIDTNIVHESSAGCCKILRHFFTRFSPLLSWYLADNNHAFEDTMTDRQLVGEILSAWPLMSRQQLGGGDVTVDAMLADEWNAHLVLFTLQSTRTCLDMHLMLEGAQLRARPSAMQDPSIIENRLLVVEERLRQIQGQPQPDVGNDGFLLSRQQMSDLQSSWESVEGFDARGLPPAETDEEHRSTLQRLLECYRQALTPESQEALAREEALRLAATGEQEALSRTGATADEGR